MDYLNDSFSQWLGEDFQKLRRILSAAKSEPVDHRVRQSPQQSTHNFHRQKHQHRQPVKTVMDCSSSKCPAEDVLSFFLKRENRSQYRVPVVPFELFSLAGLH